jgi:hypothetical protein
MNVITARNVNEALPIALSLLARFGEEFDSRNGPALRLPAPVTTTYLYPMERVLFDPVRNANPFFHFFETLWLLAGREDVAFIEEYNSRIADYSDNGFSFHGAYGRRLRRDYDQISTVATMLREDPNTRRAVLQIWDSDRDLNAHTKDLPCNLMTAFRVDSERLLHMTVFNRSNDVIWGAYGANVVQFSMLLEYIAAHAGLRVGTYAQVSNDFHVYAANPFWRSYYAIYGDKDIMPYVDPYVETQAQELLIEQANLELPPTVDFDPYELFADPTAFDLDLYHFFRCIDGYMDKWPSWRTHSFEYVVLPLWHAWAAHKAGQHQQALQHASTCAAADWQLAAMLWLARAAARAERKKQEV